MTADIRTAAEREAVERYGVGRDPAIRRMGFEDGAVWAQARVTPTREQLAIVLAKRKTPDWDAMTGAMHIASIHSEYGNADAVLALMQDLAEWESNAQTSREPA